MAQKNLQKSLSEIFGGGFKYVVPLYQRNFAWGEQEITQLLQDLYESFSNGRTYFVGSIVVIKRRCDSGELLEVIDGQQRLTVLTLLLKVLGEEYLPDLIEVRLEYDSRDEVTQFLHGLGKESTSVSDEHEVIKLFNSAISTIKNCSLDAEEEVCSLSNLKEENPKRLHEFANYLASSVYFVLAEMPSDTDVAAYFEIMNNTGEQLKMHEILKARVLNSVRAFLSVDEMKSLGTVWDACSQMDIRIQKQKSIPADQRSTLFGDNFDSFLPDNIATLASERTNSTDDAATIESIIEDCSYSNIEHQTQTENEDETENSGESIIDFPNFLMHVLRLRYNEIYNERYGTDIPLNEKFLLDVYSALENDIDGKIFVEQILYYRIILDRYIIRRDTNDEGAKWVLKRPHKQAASNGVWFSNTFGKSKTEDSDENESLSQMEDNVLTALSMLQVSYPQRKYKNYLAEILSWFEVGKVHYSLNWYLPKLNNLIKTILDKMMDDYGEKIYCLGTNTPRLLLNAIDYLMYLSDSNVHKFEYRYYNSVEHHLPQSRERQGEKYDPRIIDSLGNLYLLSRRANSSLNDRDPLTKADKAREQIESMRPNRRVIYQRTLNNRKWGKVEIKKHEEEIRTLLEKRKEILGHISIEEGPELYRACLAMDDYCAYKGSSAGGERYSFSDLNSEDAQAIVKRVEKWQMAHPKASLDNLVEENLQNDKKLNSSPWRKSFVKYPSAMQYCTNGNFAWVNDGAIIYLLPGDRITNYARELRSHILYEKAIAEKTSVSIDRYGLWFFLDNTPLVLRFPDARVSLHIWINEEGTKWCYELYSERAANAKENIFLLHNGWSRNDAGHYFLDEREFLCDSPLDYEQSVDCALENIREILTKISQL